MQKKDSKMIKNHKIEVEIRKIKNHEFNELYQLLRKKWFLDKSIKIKDYNQLIKNSSTIYVVEKKNKLVGTAMLHFQKKLIRNGSIAAFIEEVFVDEKERGKGIGSMLIQHLIKEAKNHGCYKIVLSCFDARTTFYQRCGFRKESNTMRINLLK